MNTSAPSDASFTRTMEKCRYSRAFTLLEVIVVIAVIAIIVGVGAMSFSAFDETSEVEKPADQLARMAKQASRSAVVLGKPVVIAFDKTGFGFADAAIQGKESRASIPKGMKIGVQRWNGGKNWDNAEGLNWVFYPSGICDALHFQFKHESGTVEVAFNPLTGSIVEENKFLR